VPNKLALNKLSNLKIKIVFTVAIIIKKMQQNTVYLIPSTAKHVSEGT